MAEYQRILKANLAKELGRHHDWKEKFWGRRYHSASLADTELDQQKRLRYILANGCKDGLVDSPLEWPGVSTAWNLSQGIWTMTGTWLDRSSEEPDAKGNRPIKKIEETVHLSPLPFMEGWSPDEQRKWFRDIILDIEDETRERRRSQRRRSVGVTKLLKQDPHGKPAKSKRSPGTLFLATSRVEREKLAFARAMKEAAYQLAAQRLRQGHPDINFPDDCFLPPFVRKKRGPP